MVDTESNDDGDISYHHQQYTQQQHTQQNEPFLLINNVPIHFSENWNTGIGGGLWTTGLAFARYLEHRSEDALVNLHRLASVKKYSSPSRWYGGDRMDRSDTTHDVNGISALELGSGNGFLSTCLLALVISHGNNIPLTELVITDMKDHLPLISQTLQANSHVWGTLIYDDGEEEEEEEDNLSDADTQTSTDKSQFQSRQMNLPHIVLAEHIWGEFDSKDAKNNHIHNKKYDFIFGTDLAYRNSLHNPLISSLLYYSHQHTLCLIGVTMTDTQPIFFDRLTEAGFRYEKLADHLLEPEFRGGNFGLIAIQRDIKWSNH